MRSSVCTCACHELKTLPDLPDNRTPNAIFNTSKRDRGRTKPFGEGENNLRFAFVFLLKGFLPIKTLWTCYGNGGGDDHQGYRGQHTAQNEVDAEDNDVYGME